MVGEGAYGPAQAGMLTTYCCVPRVPGPAGSPEPGGLTTRELLGAVRRIACELDLAALDVIEVSPPYDPAGITALAAHRVVLEALPGMALRRSGRAPRAERP